MKAHNYEFSDKAPKIMIPAHVDEKGNFVEDKEVKGVYAFGSQALPFTNENLTDDVAKYLLEKISLNEKGEEVFTYEGIVVPIKEKSKK